jgi:hypothetical protein
MLKGWQQRYVAEGYYGSLGPSTYSSGPLQASVDLAQLRVLQLYAGTSVRLCDLGKAQPLVGRPWITPGVDGRSPHIVEGDLMLLQVSALPRPSLRASSPDWDVAGCLRALEGLKRCRAGSPGPPGRGRRWILEERQDMDCRDYILEGEMRPSFPPLIIRSQARIGREDPSGASRS